MINTPGGPVCVEDIKPGDIVISWSSTTADIVHARVNRTTRALVHEYLEITGTEDTVRVSAEHPIYLNDAWVKAGDASVGDEFLTMSGEAETVTEITVIEGRVQVYNFQVEGTHNYFVDGKLFHNKCCFLAGTLITMADGSKKAIEDVDPGDIILSFNEKTRALEPKEVRIVEAPLREGFFTLEFHTGLVVEVTAEHPFYTRKACGLVRWCSLDPIMTHDFYDYLKDVELLETGDEVFTDQEEWVRVIGKNYHDGEVQTYNLWDIEDHKNFFANSLLAHNRCCFLAGTMITMHDGTERPIETIRAGDIVRSWDEVTGRQNNQAVLEIQAPLRDYHYLVVAGDVEIGVTNEHPFYVKDKGWCSMEPAVTHRAYPHLSGVKALEPGDLMVFVDGTTREMQKATRIDETVQTYNLWHISNTPTYYANGLLVHNRCFVANTMVDTPDGPRPIEDLKEGDLVLAFDHVTGEVTTSTVKGVMRFDEYDETLHEIKIGERVFRVTEDHPFYIDGKYTQVKDIAVGTKALSLQGELVPVLMNGPTDQKKKPPVFNLTVAEHSNYFVDGTLVHNKGGGGGGGCPPGGGGGGFLPPLLPPPGGCCPGPPGIPGPPGDPGDPGDTITCDEECQVFP